MKTVINSPPEAGACQCEICKPSDPLTKKSFCARSLAEAWKNWKPLIPLSIVLAARQAARRYR